MFKVLNDIIIILQCFPEQLLPCNQNLKMSHGGLKGGKNPSLRSYKGPISSFLQVSSDVQVEFESEAMD
jgi:hypothetical protein